MLQILLALAASVSALAVGLMLYRTVVGSPTSTERANEIAAAIREGADAFLRRQYRTVAIVGAPILFVIGISLNWWYAFGFLLGAASSAAASRSSVAAMPAMLWVSRSSTPEISVDMA